MPGWVGVLAPNLAVAAEPKGRPVSIAEDHESWRFDARFQPQCIAIERQQVVEVLTPDGSSSKTLDHRYPPSSTADAFCSRRPALALAGIIRLDEADHVALRVRKLRHHHHAGNLRHRHDRVAACTLHLLQISIRVINGDVECHLLGAAVSLADAAADPA